MSAPRYRLLLQPLQLSRRSGSPAAPLCGYRAPCPGRPSALPGRRDEGAGTQAPTADRYRSPPLATGAFRLRAGSRRGGPG